MNGCFAVCLCIVLLFVLFICWYMLLGRFIRSCDIFSLIFFICLLQKGWIPFHQFRALIMRGCWSKEFGNLPFCDKFFAPRHGSLTMLGEVTMAGLYIKQASVVVEVYRPETQSLGISPCITAWLYPQSDPMWTISLLTTTVEIVQHKTLTDFSGLACRIRCYVLAVGCHLRSVKCHLQRP